MLSLWKYEEFPERPVQCQQNQTKRLDYADSTHEPGQNWDPSKKSEKSNEKITKLVPATEKYELHLVVYSCLSQETTQTTWHYSVIQQPKCSDQYHDDAVAI